MESSEIINIIRLDGIHTPSPTFSPGFNHAYTEYRSTPSDTDIIIERIKDADVVITTRIPISDETLERCPKLKHVAVLAIGTDMVDLAACKVRGITVINVPAASIEAVSEHAVALFFALRRKVVAMHELTVGTDEWVRKISLKDDFGECPATCREEIVGILGGGPLGNRVATICQALGMTVHFAEHKGRSPSAIRPGKLPFTTVLQTSTLLFLTLPLTPSTANLLSHQEFALMRPDTLLINVARGGIVDEEALVEALEKKKIAGAATDVFFEEPAGVENSVLVRKAKEWSQEVGKEGKGGLNGRLILSPHIAWWARASIEKLRTTVAGNIEAWAKGEERNLVV